MSDPSVAAEEFTRLFGRDIEVVGRAFGRVNLIGEHTDYNGGFVLPTPIPQSTVAALARRGDRGVRVWSAELSGHGTSLEYQRGAERKTDTWLDYVQGVTAALDGAGFPGDGFDLALRSSVPLGSGLSSSAALEVSVLRAVREVFGLAFDDVQLAQIGRAAETDFVGAPIGIMDQMSASLAAPGAALFIDTRTLEVEEVPLPAGTALVVIDSGVAHNHAGGDYRTRRAECDRAAALLGVAELRDLAMADLPRADALPEPLGRRVRHVVSENQRVLDAVAAMRSDDAAALGRLFSASHRSQRDDYAVSVPEVDLLVELAEGMSGVFGARLTGGGFGGSIVALVRADDERRVAKATAEEYRRRSGRPARVLVPAPPGPGTARSIAAR
jgi:galactokinase